MNKEREREYGYGHKEVKEQKAIGRSRGFPVHNIHHCYCHRKSWKNKKRMVYGQGMENPEELHQATYRCKYTGSVAQNGVSCVWSRFDHGFVMWSVLIKSIMERRRGIKRHPWAKFRENNNERDITNVGINNIKQRNRKDTMTMGYK